MSYNAHVLKCRSCGLVFFESRSAEGELDPEETVYWNDEEQKKICLKETVRDVFLEEFHRRLKSMENYLGSPGKVLDVGCGVGHFLNTAQQCGWNVTGLDIATPASKAAKRAL